MTPDPSTSPFTSTTAFCTKDTAKHTGLKASAPGVTADKISVVAIEPALQPGQSPQGYRFNLGDEVDMLKTFAEMINQCGGINGRQIDLNVIQAQGAGDQATTLANAQADCIKATEDYKAFIVIAWAAFAAAPCITDDHKTLLLSGLATQAEYLKTAQGRNILFGETNEVAQYQAPMLDLIKSGKLKGKKVAVLYPTFTTGVDLVKANVIDLLKSKGVNVVQAEALTPDPSGDISSQYPLVVGRLKSNGVDTVITEQRRRQHVPLLRAHQGAAQPGPREGRHALQPRRAVRRGGRPQPSGRWCRRRQADQRHERLRVLGGRPAGLADRRHRRDPGHPVQQGLRRRTRRSPRTTCREPAPPAFARDPYGTVGLDLRDVPHDGTRALQRGPEPHPEVGDQGVRGAAVPRQRRGQGLTAAAADADHQPRADEGAVHAGAQQGRVPVRPPVAAARRRQLPDLPRARNPATTRAARRSPAPFFVDKS